MLLSGRGRILHVNNLNPPSAVVVQDDVSLAAVVGHPPQEQIAEVAAAARELIAAPEDASWIAAALPEWQSDKATLYRLAPTVRHDLPSPESVRDLGAADLQRIRGIPGELRRELEIECRAGTRVVAALEDDQPVAFCYAGAVTESLWDVAVDTLEPFRRRGHASACATVLIAHQLALGKRPVWGAVSHNLASHGLAKRLGFEPTDAIVVFSSRPGVNR